MVDGNVNDDLNSHFMGFFRKGDECLVTAELLIHIEVIDAVKAVDGAASHYRVDVKQGYSQLLQVVKLILNALEIAVEEVNTPCPGIIFRDFIEGVCGYRSSVECVRSVLNVV